jgi:DNA-binding LacI/PurR family transcriptional regulator/signal transduction histidine kinase
MVLTNQEHANQQHQKKRPTIGFILDWVGGRYQSQVWLGALAAAEARDANLIIFSGRSLSAPQGFLSQSNALYDVISSENLDGLVILSGTISNYVTQEEFREFVHRFQPLPIISISIELAGIPSLLIDNRGGMRAVIAHLIEVHGYRRIAFVGGPEVNDEARERFTAYRDELARHNIPFDPLLVAPGNFSELAGFDAVSTFLDERQITPEAIVAVDDDTALGVLEALEARGLTVPEEIAVTGFDDIKESRYASPPLTTVVQPFYRQAHLAVSMMLEHLNGKSIPPKIELPMEVVIRESCGCMTETVQQAGRFVEPVAELSKNDTPLTLIITAVKKTIDRDCLRQNNQRENSSLATELAESFISDLNHRNTNKFLKILRQILRLEVVQSHEIGNWQNVISSLRAAVIMYWPEQAHKDRAEELWGQARVFIGELMERVQGYQLLQFRNQSLVESEVERSVLTTLEFDELKSIAAETLPALGISKGYIMLSKAESYNPATVFLAFNETGILTPANSVVYNPLKNMIPEEFLPQTKRYTLVMEALYFQSETIGFALFEINPQQDGILYSELRQQLSSALKGASLLYQYKRKEQETLSINKELLHYRENLERMVVERTEELTLTNAQLQQEILERKKAESERENLIKELTNKNAELERFTYTVSHDLKSPLVTIKGFLGFLKQDIASGNLERFDIDLERIGSAAKKMEQLLKDLLELSRIGRVLNPIEPISFNALADEVLSIVHGQVETRGIKVSIQPNLPVVFGDRQRLTEVLQNLIDNAAKYMGDQPNPRVEVGQRRMEGNRFIFYVRDNGIGIPPQHHERVFGLFNKLDVNSEGTGVGLALVKRIVEFHGGQIWIESEGDNMGTCVYFTLEGYTT